MVISPRASYLSNGLSKVKCQTQSRCHAVVHALEGEIGRFDNISEKVK